MFLHSVFEWFWYMMCPKEIFEIFGFIVVVGTSRIHSLYNGCHITEHYGVHHGWKGNETISYILVVVGTSRKHWKYNVWHITKNFDVYHGWMGNTSDCYISSSNHKKRKNNNTKTPKSKSTIDRSWQNKTLWINRIYAAICIEVLMFYFDLSMHCLTVYNLEELFLSYYCLVVL